MFYQENGFTELQDENKPQINGISGYDIWRHLHPFPDPFNNNYVNGERTKITSPDWLIAMVFKLFAQKYVYIMF